VSDDAVAAEFSRILGAMIDRNFALEVGRDAALARVAELEQRIRCVLDMTVRKRLRKDAPASRECRLADPEEWESETAKDILARIKAWLRAGE
jgi:hypothetical protein